MKIVVIVEFSAVLEPDNFWPRLAPSHTDEYNFVAQDVFVVKVGGFCDFSSLGMAVVFLRLLVRVLAVWRRPHLAVGRVPALFLLADSQLVIGADPRSLGHFSLRWRTSIMGHCNSICFLPNVDILDILTTGTNTRIEIDMADIQCHSQGLSPGLENRIILFELMF